MIGQPSNRFVQQKKEKDKVFLLFLYPDPGSNRDGLPHWCLRPARLPIPPSGHTLYRDCGCKDRENFLPRKKFSLLFSFYFSRPAADGHGMCHARDIALLRRTISLSFYDLRKRLRRFHPLGVTADCRSIWQAKSFINRLIPHKSCFASFTAPRGGRPTISIVLLPRGDYCYIIAITTKNTAPNVHTIHCNLLP